MVDASEFLCKDLFVVPYIQVIDDLIKLEDSFSGTSDSTTDSMSKIMLDGSFIVTVSKDHIDFWVSQNGDFAFSIQNPNGNFTSATFSEDSELLIITSENKTAEIWSLKKDLQFIRKK